MIAGMLWLCADLKRPLTDNIEQAAEYYKEKYGVNPTHCEINQKNVDRSLLEYTKRKVVVSKSVLPGHLWIGVDNG